MACFRFQWTPALIAKLANRAITPDDFEDVVCFPRSQDISRSTGRPIAFGCIGDGRYVACVYELEADGITVIPFTAFEAPEPRA